ncbi:hypothetical protein CIW48_08080 [Methylobacterium sp. P1-11]|nr:hypothetical protein CIW48_08080 [Methylobacterium sp. P1-11]
MDWPASGTAGLLAGIRMNRVIPSGGSTFTNALRKLVYASPGTLLALLMRMTTSPKAPQLVAMCAPL